MEGIERRFVDRDQDRSTQKYLKIKIPPFVLVGERLGIRFRVYSLI